MLRETLACRRRNIRITREVEESKSLEGIKVDPIKDDIEIHLDSRWWLEKLFDRMRLSFVQGTLLIYGCVELVRFLLFPFVLGAPAYFLIPYTSALVGDMFIPISLLLVHSIYKGLVRLVDDINASLKAKKFVAPPVLLSEDVLALKDGVKNLDDQYRNRYIKPVMLVTLQKGLDLSFDRCYQLGCALVAVGTFGLLMFLVFVLRIVPPGILVILEPGIPEIAFAYRLVFVYIVGSGWAIVGMVAWTLFTSWLITIQVSGNPIGMRPFEPIKEHFDSIMALMLRISFTVAFFVAWLSPLFLFWSVVPTDSLFHQSVVTFLLFILIVTTPIIILSIVFPVLKTHKGLCESRKRASVIKLHQLEDLKRKDKTNLRKYLTIQKHLIDDYRNIISNPEWVLSASQLVQIFSSIFLPILTFIVSISLYR
jgi:hypothetical protein